MHDEAKLALIRANKVLDTYTDTKKRLDELAIKLKKETTIQEEISQARDIVQIVLANVQTSFKMDVEDLMTLAIRSIFGRFSFSLNWKKLKNRSDLNFIIMDGQDEYSLADDDLGGSILDIVSFASRPIFHRYQPKRTRKILFFDEAFKWIGRGSFQDKAAELIRRVSTDEGYQIIFITHEQKYSIIADKAFLVSNKGNQSAVTELNPEEIGGMI